MKLLLLTLECWSLTASLFTAVGLLRLARRRTPMSAATPLSPLRVLLLRPVDAPTEQELDNLAAPVDLPPGAELRHVVLSPYRPRLGAGVEWLYSDPVTANRKVGHLLHAFEVLELEGMQVLAIDADVRVDAALVQGLVTSLEAGAGASTAAPSPEGGHGLAARALRGLLRHTHHSFHALEAMSAGAKTMSGKAVGLSAAARAELLGLGEHIGEDLELAKRLHARGHRVGFCTAPARVPQRPASAVLERITRWMQVLRAHRPGLYPSIPLLFAPTWPLLLGAALLSHPPLSALVLLLLFLRTALALALASPGEKGAAMSGWLLGEALLLTAFGVSLGRRTVTWRGRRFSLARGGRMLTPPGEAP